MNYQTKIHRCISCGFRDAEVILRPCLELCLECLEERISSIEPATDCVIVLRPSGYDYPQEEDTNA